MRAYHLPALLLLLPGCWISPTSGSSATLSWESTSGRYALDELSSSQYQASTSYGLDSFTSGFDVPVGLTQLARTPAAFSITSPNLTGSAGVGRA